MPDRLDAGDVPSAANAPEIRIVRITRERTSVIYEIDHAGTALHIRMYPTDDGRGEATWRIEATIAESDALSINATAATRAVALDEVARAWRNEQLERRLPVLHWKAIVRLMSTSRAL